MSEKTEEPTDKKVQDARKKGQVGVSQDVSKLMATTAVLAYLFSAQDGLMSSGKEAILFSISKTNVEFKQAAGEVCGKVFHVALGVAISVVGIALVMKIVGTWM